MVAHIVSWHLIPKRGPGPTVYKKLGADEIFEAPIRSVHFI